MKRVGGEEREEGTYLLKSRRPALLREHEIPDHDQQVHDPALAGRALDKK